MLIGGQLAPHGIAGADSDHEKREYEKQDAFLTISEFQYGTGCRQGNAEPEQECSHHATPRTPASGGNGELQ
jgi:hypothetical protein